MAVFTNQRVFIDKNLRPFAEEIFGAIPIQGGFQWKTGTSHPSDPNPAINSAAINAALEAAEVTPPELVVVVLQP